MISSPTPTSFFQVPASKVPDPIEKFAGMIVSGRHTLGLREAWVCAVLQEERGMEQWWAELGKTEGMGVLGSRSTTSSGGSDGVIDMDEVIDMCDRS